MKYLADVAGIFPPCSGILQIGKSFLNRVIVPILFLWILLIEFLPFVCLYLSIYVCLTLLKSDTVDLFIKNSYN